MFFLFFLCFHFDVYNQSKKITIFEFLNVVVANEQNVLKNEFQHRKTLILFT